MLGPMRLIAYATALVFMCGCFRWAPVTSLSSIQNDRVLIREGDDSAIINRATADGQIIEGQADVGGAHVQVDAVQSHVFVRRLNVPATALIITGAVVATAATAFAALVAIILASSRAIPDVSPPP